MTKKIDDLSLGNKKKVGIVQGLLHEPKLIILDEPTSGLDPLMQQRFFNLLIEENKKGATILFSSHILSEVQRLCDRVAIIKEGKIVTVEKISNLQENNYKKIKIETVTAVNHQFFNIAGVNNFNVEDNKVSFIFKGDINSVMKKIAEIEIHNIWIEEPDLEEIFMHYYERGTENDEYFCSRAQGLSKIDLCLGIFFSRRSRPVHVYVSCYLERN